MAEMDVRGSAVAANGPSEPHRFVVDPNLPHGSREGRGRLVACLSRTILKSDIEPMKI